MSRATGRHTRPKKLNPKQNVQIFREEQVEIVEYDSAHATIETGVEKNEESEYHLQQAIKASQAAKAEAAAVKDAFIPTPPTITSEANYDQRYAKGYHHPATYIRSSSTVEDLAGSPYCMDEEDDVAFKVINGSLPAELLPCTEDQFEDVMGFFEETAQIKQPYATVDNSPVLSCEELEEQYDDTVPAHVRRYARYFYEHWKSRRTESGNRILSPRLKFETGVESDDQDPYVCFRRREIRQQRKTRNRDAQSADKLKRLRVELEGARLLLQLVKSREIRRKEQLELDRKVFMQRHEAKKMKRELGIKGDDEDFINQRPSSKRPALSPGQQALAQQLRLPVGRGGTDDQLKTLEEHQAQKEDMIAKDINNNIEKHIRWNEGFVDKTAFPLSPTSDWSASDQSNDYRRAMPATVYLPTPPASVSDEEKQDTDMADVQTGSSDSILQTPFRYASPVDDGRPMPSFRRRVGRGGRMMIDRRLPFRSRTALRKSESRFAFDDSDDQLSDDPLEDDQADSVAIMQYRAHLFSRVKESEAAQAQAQAARRAAQVESTTEAAPPSISTTA